MKAFRATLVALLGVGLVIALIAGGVMLWSLYLKEPSPLADRCVAQVADQSTVLDPEQARYASIIAGMSIKRDLKPRAASIALATAYQESGIRNLNYGHADSLGLFQQRPSKGWGSVEEIMDPWYSTREFYRAMVRVKDWETRDINDVAQAVQRSAFPEAYRQHEVKARTLASSLTGETPASFSCRVASPGAPDPGGMRKFLVKTLGKEVVKVTALPTGLQVATTDPSHAWAVAHLAVANTADYGLSAVRIGGYGWSHSTLFLASWAGSGPTAATEVVLEFG